MTMIRREFNESGKSITIEVEWLATKVTVRMIEPTRTNENTLTLAEAVWLRSALGMC